MLGIVSTIARKRNTTANDCDHTKDYVVLMNLEHYTYRWIQKEIVNLSPETTPRFEIKPEKKIICKNNSVRFTLTQLHDVPGKSRWLGNITNPYKSLSNKTQFHLELDTFERGARILKWDREISPLSVLLSNSTVKYDPSILAKRKDILYFSEARANYSFTGEVLNTNETSQYLAFVIEFDELTDYPIVKRLYVLDTEVCGKKVGTLASGHYKIRHIVSFSFYL